MSNSAICQEFVQNAWKRDLCSNCFKTRTDHHHQHSPAFIEVTQSSPIVVSRQEEDDHRQNGFGKMKTKRRNDANGVQLWEVGDHRPRQRLPDKTDNGDIKGILKDKKKSSPNNMNGDNRSRNGLSSKEKSRRGSVVGFSEATPQVIGYGGHDYEWDDDQESSDEPSDVDSLENFDLSTEEKEFTELTDTNTQYNAENLTLVNELDINLNRSPITNGKQTSLVSKLNTQTSYFIPSSNLEKDLNSINGARNFICSHLYGDGDDFGSTLDDVDVEDEVVVDSSVKIRESDMSKVVTKAGCDTAPSSTGRRSVVRPSVQDLFNKEEPVTAAEFAAVAEKRHSPLATHSACSPYGIVSISSISSKMEGPPSEAPPGVPTTPPVPSPDAQIPNEKRPQTLSIQSNNNDAITGKDEMFESLDKVIEKRMNRNYEVIVKSCHYASANVSNGVATPPLIPNASNAKSEEKTASVTSSLPPTPLTSPYSSTAILKGIPSNSKPDDLAMKTKPPVIKPKPKIPAKPTQLSSPTTPSPEPPIFKKELNNTGNNLSVESPSLDVAPSSLSDANESINEVTKTSGPGSIDSGKRSTKRPAPRPPTEPPHAAGVKNSCEESRILSPTEEVKLEVQTVDVVESKPEIPTSDSSTKVESISRGSVNGSLPSLTDESSANTGPYGVPNNSSNSVVTVINGSRETPRDVNNKSKKSKFSLKKLLKFGSAREDHSAEHRRSKSERRSKLEIIHPIDLIQSSRTDLANVSTLPSSPDSSFGSSGSSSDRPILTKMTTFGSPPVSPGWISVGVPTTKAATEHNGSPATDIQLQGLAGDVVSPVDEQPPQWNSSLTNISSNGINGKSNKMPHPPPRSRCQINDEQPNNIISAANKDKPMRPPPPLKVSSLTNETDVLYNEEQDPVDLVEMRHTDDELTNDRGERGLNGLMDYANLGDIRTSLAPKKPGRWPSGSMMEMSDDVEGSDEAESAQFNNIIHLEKTPQCEVTYYAPPNDLEDLETEELYADHVAVVPSTESSQLSSLTSESTSSSQSTKQSDVSEEKSKSTNGFGLTGIKIYERVVLKRGGLEKVYASSPTALSPTDQTNSTGLINDVDEMNDMGGLIWPRRKSSRLSLRKLKTIVHKNLEDNYGAVVAANHQTLTKILEQVSLTHPATSSKAKILEDVSLHWSDFSLLEDSQVTVVGPKAFYSAICKQQNLETTLMVTRETLCSPTQPTRNPCVMVPIAEFHNFIPDTYFAPSRDSDGSSSSHGTVWVMERMRVETVLNVAENLQLQQESDPDAYEREVCFILLQLINGLKHLQVLGIEEIEADLSDFLLVMKNNESNYRLVILPKSAAVTDSYYQFGSRSAQEKFSLGRGALEVMRLLFQEASTESLTALHDAFSLIAEILQQEKADSLSQAKRLLEYLLWGPANLGSLDTRPPDSSPIMDQEQTFQRWLDLERANVLNNLIRTQSLWQIRLTILEEYMLSFFVRTCAKSLREASSQLQMTSKVT